MNKRSATRILGRIRRNTTARAGRGQSLVEFALVLPVILLLVLVGLDFGRVYLGYINVQNMARIAANYAANNPTAWSGTPDAAILTKYRNQVLADATATNCKLPVSGGTSVVPAPVFSDANGDGSTTNLGDNVRVDISCTFTVITPVIANIVGGSIQVTAESNFPVKTGLSSTAAGGGGGGPILPTAAFTGNDVVSTRVTPYPMLTDVSPFDVEFRDTSGGTPTSWSWTFGDGATSGAQDPLIHTFTCTDAVPCVRHVSMVATNANGSSTAYMDITVLPASGVDFSANRTLISPGMSVSFTDRSTGGPTAWAWTFGDGATSTSQSPSHTYAAAGTYDVALTATFAAPTGDITVTKVAYIRVQTGLCEVPRLIGVRFNSADAVFRGAPYSFTGHVQRAVGANNGNFTIVEQDLTATSLAPCTSNINVK
jgi:PKD repeat protein